MNKIYLDNNSTTKLDSRVLEAMNPYYLEKYGNASSTSHAYGWEAQAAVDLAREQVAKLINADPDEIIFTSGATEANNLAISGYNNNYNRNIITSSIEHKAVLDICNVIKNKKECLVSFIKPKTNGILDIVSIEEAINLETGFISMMHANNEIGTINPINRIGKLCKKNNIIFHVDAAQSLGKIKIDVKKMNIDLLSLSGHKIYGPKGIGALYIKNKTSKINLSPIIVGGGQEKNYRSGTLPVPLIVGFGMASNICNKEMNKDTQKIKKLTTMVIKDILNSNPLTKINGCLENRIPGNINFSFPFLNGMSIIRSMPKIAVSSGSACTSSSPLPSHVLMELGLTKKEANTSIRIGIGKFNTIKEINVAIDSIKNALGRKV